MAVFYGINEKVLNTTTKLCSNHFQKKDIINKAKGSIIKLNAVPCIIKKKIIDKKCTIEW